jgi:guanine deaminase
MKVRKEQSSKFFLKEAIRLARIHMKAKDGGPFGAVIVQNSTIIARGWNQVTSKNDPTAHAEVVCIRNACSFLQTFDLSGCELFVNCEPCPMCLSAAYWARIEKITYGADHNDAAAIGFDDALIYKELQKKPSDRKITMVQMLRNEALAGFQLWNEMEDKIRY